MSEKIEAANKSRVGFSSELLNSLPNAFRLWAASVSRNIDVCQPCIVEAYDRSSHLVQVRPLVKRKDLASGEEFEKASLVVSAWRWQTGGFVIDLPVNPGDTGWIFAGDRDTAEAKAKNSSIQDSVSYEQGKRNPEEEGRNYGPQPITGGNEKVHILSSGFYLPDMWGRVDFADEDRGSLVIQQLNRDGSTWGKITVRGDGTTEMRSSGRNGGFLHTSKVTVFGDQIALTREDVDETKRDAVNAKSTESLRFGFDKGFEWSGAVDSTREVICDIRDNDGVIEVRKVTEGFRGCLRVSTSEPTDWIKVTDIRAYAS